MTWRKGVGSTFQCLPEYVTCDETYGTPRGLDGWRNGRFNGVFSCFPVDLVFAKTTVTSINFGKMARALAGRCGCGVSILSSSSHRITHWERPNIRFLDSVSQTQHMFAISTNISISGTHEWQGNLQRSWFRLRPQHDEIILGSRNATDGAILMHRWHLSWRCVWIIILVTLNVYSEATLS